MKISNIRKLMSLAVLAVLAACTADEAVEKEEGGVNPDGTVTQNIQFFISGSASPSDILTRDVPPGVNPGLEDMAEGIPGCNVDRIRLLTFRRQEGTDDSFVYDAGNSTDGTDAHPDLTAKAMAFTAEDGKTISEAYGRGAKGTIKKTKGYEYRVIAIGYYSNREIKYPSGTHPENFSSEYVDESDLFKIVDNVVLDANNTGNPVPTENELKDGVSKFEDVSLQIVPRSFEDKAGYITAKDFNKEQRKNLTGWYVVTPEIFYGTCRSVDSGSDIITFSDENEITGYMYRGVAKLTVDISNLQSLINKTAGDRHVCSVALLADSVKQAVRLADYENFKTPYFPFDELESHVVNGFGVRQKETPTHTFTAIAIDGYVPTDPADEECHEYDNSLVTFETFLLPTQTRLYMRYSKGTDIGLYHNTEEITGDALLLVNNKSDGMQATGVIDPIAGGEFVYFRRNQRYSIIVDWAQLQEDLNMGNVAFRNYVEDKLVVK